MKLETLIYVSNLQNSVHFYVNVLGFSLGQYFPNETSPTCASIFAGKYKLMLCPARASNKKFYPHGLGGSGFQLFVKVDDVDAVYRKIKDKIVIIDDLENKNWGDREFTLKDPDGYLISFYTPS